jgi:YidC/Oxa1 family membrane protein insertase
MSSFPGVPVDAAYHLVYALAGALAPVLGGLATAAGIIIFTMAVRLLIAPLSFRALRGQAAQARLAPELQKLRQRYGKQPERLRRELTALQAREGTSLLAGIWPLLAQWPFLSVMYLLFRSAQVGGGPNELLAHRLLAAPLGAHWLSGAGALSAQGGVFLGLFAILAALSWLSARIARRMAAAAALMNPAPATASGGVRLITAALPYLTVVFAAFLPLAAGLYLVTTVAWTTGERWLFTHRAATRATPSPGIDSQPARRRRTKAQMLGDIVLGGAALAR